MIPDRWPYFLWCLHMSEPWREVRIGSLVQISKLTSVDAVSQALSWAHVSPPTIHYSAYGWLLATARALNEGAI